MTRRKTAAPVRRPKPAAKVQKIENDGLPVLSSQPGAPIDITPPANPDETAMTFGDDLGLDDFGGGIPESEIVEAVEIQPQETMRVTIDVDGQKVDGVATLPTAPQGAPVARAEDRVFVNRLKLLTFMDADDLEGVGLDVSFGGGVWPAFRDNPFRWLMQASEDEARAVYELLEAVEAYQKEQGR